jgi:hypothetical protein
VLVAATALGAEYLRRQTPHPPRDLAGTTRALLAKARHCQADSVATCNTVTAMREPLEKAIAELPKRRTKKTGAVE